MEVLGLFLGVASLASGGLWLLAPQLHARRLPDDHDEIWSLPRLNGLAFLARYIRWVSRVRGRQLALGSIEVLFGLLLVSSAIRSA